MSARPFLTTVRLRNYRSIASAEVRLRPLTFLVGPNGSGKSNFLDALRFVADALRTSLDQALRDRNGIKEVRMRSAGHPTHFSLSMDFQLGGGGTGSYEFRIGARARGGYEVQSEECRVRGPDALAPEAWFRVRSGEVEASVATRPPAASDRLYLVNAAGLPQFRPVFDAFSRMGFYNLNPAAIREPQPPDAGDMLARDGWNLPSVIARLGAESPETKIRIEEYLEKVVPGVVGVDRKVMASRETIEFRQVVRGAASPWKFDAANMSDGTLRALGILAAIFQPGNGAGGRVTLVGLEEPELALHPGAAGILRDGLREASEQVQVVVTSHSPELIDDERIDSDSLLAVSCEGGTTRIARPDAAARTALADRLYTAGELLRLNQLQPEEGPEEAPAPRQGDLLEGVEGCGGRGG